MEKNFKKTLIILNTNNKYHFNSGRGKPEITHSSVILEPRPADVSFRGLQTVGAVPPVGNWILT